MGAINIGDKVLVTGASGYLGAHVTKKLLEKGFPVRGTVRSESKGEYLAELFKEYRALFEYAVVKDMAQEGAFDEVVLDVHAVAHTASPFHFTADDPRELFEPAVNGTTGLLKSVQRMNPLVKRVVVTSSVAAVEDARISGYHVRDEGDWNDISIAICDEEGRRADGVVKYRASKTLAEKAFWSFLDGEDVGFDGVTILPSLILGPALHQVNRIEDLNTSVAIFASWAAGKHTQSELPGDPGNYVDVRDCALGHVLALTRPAATGQRFITSSGPMSPNDFCLAINAFDPTLPNVPQGDLTLREQINASGCQFSHRKSKEILGIQYRPIEETLQDSLADLRARSWI